MTAQAQVRASHQELADAIASGVLSEPLRVRANAILDRLEKPVRLTVMGQAGSGKSTLLNLLLGQNVLPEGRHLPTIGLSFGATESAEVTLADGTKQTLNHADMKKIAAMKPVFVEAKLPLPALAKLSMLEVVAGEEPEQQKRALLWAAKRTDIGLWCTVAFGASEQALWANMPDEIQDHGFLILTKADAIAARGELGQRVEMVRSSGKEAFKTILAIGTREALAARKPDGSLNKEAMRSSGGVALISSILKAVDTGRQAAADQAEVFLRQIGYVPREVIHDLAADGPAKQQKNHEITKVLEELPDSPKAPDAPLDDTGKALCQEGLERLRKCGDDWAKEDLDEQEILEAVTDTVMWLSDHLADGANPSLKSLAETAIDAADLCQLIQLETGDALATDALSVMVQLKDELEATLATA